LNHEPDRLTHSNQEEGPATMASLARPSNDRVIAGVCSGIARRFGLSSNVVRLIFVLSMLLPGPQILIYLAGWLLIPDERKRSVY